jgi:hypothetical protein
VVSLQRLSSLLRVAITGTELIGLSASRGEALFVYALLCG